MPKRVYNKHRKVIPVGVTWKGCEMASGVIGIKILEPLRVNAKVIEAVRVVINRTCSRKGYLRQKVFPSIPVSKKPLEVRMGGGKGPIEERIAALRAGTIIFELSGVDLETSTLACQKASSKLGVKTKIVKNRFAVCD